MFAAGMKAPPYEAAALDSMRRAKEAGQHGVAFDLALFLILPALRAHLAQQSEICRVI